jgi:hypothetical protein
MRYPFVVALLFLIAMEASAASVKPATLSVSSLDELAQAATLSRPNQKA